MAAADRAARKAQMTQGEQAAAPTTSAITRCSAMRKAHTTSDGREIAARPCKQRELVPGQTTCFWHTPAAVRGDWRPSGGIAAAMYVIRDARKADKQARIEAQVSERLDARAAKQAQRQTAKPAKQAKPGRQANGHLLDCGCKACQNIAAAKANAAARRAAQAAPTPITSAPSAQTTPVEQPKTLTVAQVEQLLARAVLAGKPQEHIDQLRRLHASASKRQGTQAAA